MNKPAFPQLVAIPDEFAHGMTLRDYFAAKALQGFVSILNGEGGEPFYGAIAIDSYKMADAMLKVREHGNT